MERQQLFREVAYLRNQRLSIRANAAKLDVNRGRVERALKAGALGQLPGEPAASPSPNSLAADIFVGYQRELAELQACLEDTLRGRENLAMLVGEPGIGKTRMARSWRGTEQIAALRCCGHGIMKIWGPLPIGHGCRPSAPMPWHISLRSYAASWARGSHTSPRSPLS